MTEIRARTILPFVFVVNGNRRGQSVLTTTPWPKNVPHLACYNFDVRRPFLIIFGTNGTQKVVNQFTSI